MTMQLSCDSCGTMAELNEEYPEGWTKQQGKIVCLNCRLRGIENNIAELKLRGETINGNNK